MGDKKRNQMMKRFTLPKGCSIKTFVMRELKVKDDIEVAIWADKNTPAAAKESAVGAMAADRREALRLALVEVDGVRVNVNGIPYMAMDDWSQKTMTYALMAFNDLNGAADDAKGFLKAGEFVNENELSPALVPEQKDTEQ